MTQKKGTFSKGNKAATESNKRRQTIKDALSLALHREVEAEDEHGKKVTKRRINVLADRLVRDAINGDNVAAKEVLDRTEGKAPQSMTLEGNPDKPMTGNFVFVPVGSEEGD